MPTTRTFITRTQSFAPGNLTYRSQDRLLRWENSARVGGRLILIDQPHTRIAGRVGSVSVRTVEGMRVNVSAGPSSSAAYYGFNVSAWTPLENEVYARFRKKLYDGNGALGVTFASFKQSRDMIANRYATLTGRVDHWSSILENQPRPKQVAGFHLEVIFGWMPLLADVQAATRTIAQKAIPPVYVKAKKTKSDKYRVRTSTPDSGVFNNVSSLVTYRSAWAATVRINNPNLWLAERAGTLNAAAVGWDLVPWSFVVNMFVNTGQLVNSVTDYAGLDFLRFSRTRVVNIQADVVTTRFFNTNDPVASCWHIHNEKTRDILPGPPNPRLQFKIPELNWSTVAMAASLFTQKFTRLASLFPRK